MNTRFFALFCCVSLCLFNVVSTTQAQDPQTGRIVFESWRDGNGEIYVMNADGGNQVNLTRNGSRDGAPVWSPDGKYIAFHSDRDGVRDIYIMDANGRNVRRVLRSLTYREYPTWSPDGKMIAYSRAEDWALCVADIGAGVGKRVASTNKLGGFPDWSPDGTEIAFIVTTFGDYSLHVVNLESGKEKILFAAPPNKKPAKLFDPAWSPTGDKIAFRWSGVGVYVIDRHGRQLKKIVEGSRPAWSPEGEQLLYDKDLDLFTTNMNGLNKALLARDGFNGDWSAPETLSVEYSSNLLTTIWGQLKQRK